jgi:hypothetical protein
MMRTKSTLSKIIHLILGLIIVGAVFAMSCSSDKEPETAVPKQAKERQSNHGFSNAVLQDSLYEGWREYFDEFLVIYCPPDSELLERIPSISTQIKKVFIENAVRLKVKLPIPIIFYLYNNTTEIEERTDCENTCVEGNIIHYMLFTPLGLPIMTRLLEEFDMDGTPCTFCYEGLITFLDYSGRNFIEEAYIDLYNDKLPPITSIIDRNSYLQLDSTTRSVAAASLVEFMLSHPWNPDMFMELYQRNGDTRKNIEEIYGISLKEIGEKWFTFLTQKSGLNMEY